MITGPHSPDGSTEWLFFRARQPWRSCNDGLRSPEESVDVAVLGDRGVETRVDAELSLGAVSTT
jgi:hypothetical protein